MNNRGEGEMDENEAAFLSSLLPPSQPLFLPLFCDPLFFFNSRTKKDFINNLRDFLGAVLTLGHVACNRQRYVCRDCVCVCVRETCRTWVRQFEAGGNV